MTAPKALNAIYRDKECPPWPIEGELSIYPRESLCRIIISRQGKICGKRISDSCAGSLRQHVKTAHLPDNIEGRQRHLQKLELNTGKLGPPGREVVAEVVKEFIRRYKNPPDLDIIHFDEDSSSDDEQEEAEEDLASEVGKSELSSISEHEQEDEDEDEDSRSQGGRSESTSTEDSSPPPDRLSEEPYESAFEENLEKGKESILEVRSGQVGPQITGDDGEEVKDEENKSDPVDQNEDNDDKSGEVESTQEDMSDFSSVTGYERATQEEEEEEEDQVFEEDVESWKEERTWEINSKRGEEFVMWDYDEEEIMAPLKRQHSNESNTSKHHQVKEEKREETPPKRQREEEDENEKDKEDRKETKDATPSKRQRTDENKGIENQDNITLPVETIIKKEESPEPSEVYYLASEGVSPDEGTCLDHEGDISMSGL